jgi:tripartite-type tricarboxylate transporter receptor subunit TctC
MLVSAMGAEATLIPYRGIAPAVNDLLGEHIDFTQVAASVAAPHIRAGSMKAYASTASERMTAFPDLPTLGEAGYKDLERPFWHALFAPAATPKPVLERLNAALQETLADPLVQKAYGDTGVETYPRNQWSLAAADKFLHEELAFWGKAARDNNVKPE